MTKKSNNDLSRLSGTWLLKKSEWTITQVPDRQKKEKKKKQTVEGVAFSGRKIIKTKILKSTVLQ